MKFKDITTLNQRQARKFDKKRNGEYAVLLYDDTGVCNFQWFYKGKEVSEKQFKQLSNLDMIIK